ncbi:glycine betaine ABC transporter substrate-binding protein [Streptomyces tardus]|uniref:glycine betaine ABC transporter substrate-binding protein n=1 Tax=Streptomyces tardus TaxID=2780544 RepID=UPI0027E3D74C|nr:glycine betaine ABC transporter substrate-binding protein [Streptomyces tardus]
MRTALAAGTTALVLVALTACGAGASSGGQSEDGQKVTLIASKWVGGQANVAVAAHILKKELGYDVEITELADPQAWKALDSGKADAMLEDWDHPGRRDTYVRKRKSVVSAGELGIKGRIGWYVPRYLANSDRDVTRWQKLNDKAELFAADGGGEENSEGPGDGGPQDTATGEPESGGPGSTSTEGPGATDDGERRKGLLLQGDPSYKSHDQAIIDNLGLDLELEHLGSEDKQLEFMREAAKDEKPFLTYWWTPHWLESEVELAEVKLPEHYTGCDADPEKVACGYPETDLEKFHNADFDRNGGKAAAFLRNFTWGQEDQNEVARLIADDDMSLEAAGAKWAAENEAIWSRWLWDLEN